MPPKHCFEVAKKAPGSSKKKMGCLPPKRAIQLFFGPFGAVWWPNSSIFQKNRNALGNINSMHPKGDIFAVSKRSASFEKNPPWTPFIIKFNAI